MYTLWTIFCVASGTTTGNPFRCWIPLCCLFTENRTVMSDWGGTNSVVDSIEAGCDLQMPVSDEYRGEKTLEAVEDGRLSREAVEKAAANVLYLVERTKGSDLSAEPAEREDDRQETRQLIRNAGVEGLTLLKNEGG